MPLVRISLLRGKGEAFGRKVGELVYRAMVDTLNVPVKDKFQVITEHSRESLIFDPEYLDIERSEGFIGRLHQPGRGQERELVVRQRHSAVRRLTCPT
jgi:predicted metalloprotease